jgi:hypothetical protein
MSSSPRVLHRRGIGGLEALGLLERVRDHERHPSQVRIALGQIGRRGHRDANATPGDAHPVLGLRPRLALRRHEDRLGVLRVQSDDLGVAEDVLVAAEGPTIDRVTEDLALAEHRVLLPRLDPAFSGEIDEDPVALRGHHQALRWPEGLNHVLEHEAEGGADLIRRPRPRRPDQPRQE